MPSLGNLRFQTRFYCVFMRDTVTKRQEIAKKEEAAAAVVKTPAEPALVIPDDPKKLTATFIEPGTVVLKWQAVDKAIGYVLRQTPGSTIDKKCSVGNFLNLKSISNERSFTDVSPGTYTYRLCTLGSGNVESEGTVVTVIVPEPPAVVTDPKPTPSSIPVITDKGSLIGDSNQWGGKKCIFDGRSTLYGMDQPI